MIALIVAAAENDVIGRDGSLPWHLGTDLRRFKALTMGKPIVMGRKTFDSIGRALPGRQNIVITRQSDYIAPDCDVVTSSDAAIAAAGDAGELMVIGGGEIYRLFLPLAERIYLTRVATRLTGDARFPVLAPETWRESAREEHPADERNDHAFTFSILDRVR